MNEGSSILLLSDATFCFISEGLLGRGHRVERVGDIEECLRALHSRGADLLIVCLPLGDRVPGDTLARIRQADARLDVIVCGTVSGFSPADAVDLGVFEYIADPQKDLSSLLSAVGVALGARRGDVQLRYLREKDAAGVNLESLVGQHPSMQKTLQFVRQFCARTVTGGAPTVLLLGETGTGKGVIAKCMHYNSIRRPNPFVEVNCAAIPAALIESELFGYERGAFTDAKSSRSGLFETANGGTLFLDEIGSLPYGAQAKLLTAIEEKRIRRVGGRHATVVDVQVIAAGHPILKDAVRTGEFREDLYHRLNVLSTRLPPLRNRGEDKLRLAESFIIDFCHKYGMPVRALSSEARMRIMSYAWPGNVRELRNQIERIVLLFEDATIEEWHFDRQTSIYPAPLPSVPVDVAGNDYVLRLPPQGISLNALERDAILQALDRCDGNVSGAARFLKITRQTLMYRIKKHGIGVTAPRLLAPSVHHDDDGGTLQ